MKRAFIVGVAVSSFAFPASAVDWMSLSIGHGTTILYQPGYESDRDFSRTWLDRAAELAKSKYGVTATGYRMSFYLYAEPNEHANVGLAETATTGAAALSVIHYLAPSAVVWKSTNRTTSLGFPYDDNFHAKVIISEYIALAHLALQDSRTQRGGWRYHAAPQWVSQGLQECDAIFHSTEFNRTTVAARLRQVGLMNPMWFSCCKDDSPEISDVYNGGALFMWYLADRFGEDIHRRVLQSSAPTFGEALMAETKSANALMLVDDFRRWIGAPN